jgi:hypothetical protein
MSKKYGIMDKHFQLYNLKNIYNDTVDILSLTDSTLHLPENINNINNILGISKKKVYYGY